MKTVKRYSKKREAILQSICGTDTHPSADWVYGRLKPVFSDLSLGTVYRNIAQFKEEGKIVCVGVFGGQERYDGNTKLHCHFVCKQCHQVADVHIESADKDLYELVESKYGMEVHHHETVFWGKCTDCRDARE